jgi:Ser/Thr protein kinase RdoA (MazF antagonist)
VSALAAPTPPGRVLAALVRSGLVDAVTACDREVSIRDASRSNPVHVLAVDGASRLVVKEAGPAVDAGCFLAAEAAAYRWLAREPRLTAIAPRVAALPGDDGWLVLDAVADAHSMYELIGTLDDEFRELVAELACLLARLHLTSARAGRGGAILPRRRPWLLELPGGALPGFVTANLEARRLVADLRGRPELMALVENVGAAWRSSAAIHGDVKWDNVLVRRQSGGGWRLWLIDWELAGWGDPAWDLAALVEGVVTTSVLADAALDCGSAMPIVRDAVHAYGKIVGRGSTIAPERLARFVGARLLQVAVQLAAMTETHGDLAAACRELLDLAGSLAADPLAWARRLMGAGV